MAYTLYKLVNADLTSRNWIGRKSNSMQWRRVGPYKRYHAWMKDKQSTGEYLFDKFGPGKYRLIDNRKRIIFEGTVKRTWRWN